MPDIANSGRRQQQQAAPPAGGRAPAGGAPRRYGIAVASVAAATLLMFALYELPAISRGSAPFIFYFLAVILSARHCGRGPALLSIVLSAAVADYFFLQPFNSLSLGVESVIQAGVFVLVSFFIAQVTDRSARAEADAQARGEELATTLRSIGDAVIATDAGGRVTFMNPVAEKLTGWTGAEARGRDLSEVFRIVSEETREPVESPLARVLREGGVVGLANHTVVVGRDGRETPIEDSAAPIKDRAGNTVGVVLVFHDVTERQRADELVRRSEQQLRLVTDSAPLFISYCDSEARFRFVNRPYARRFGLEPEQIVGRPIADVLGPEAYEAIRPHVEAALAGERVAYEAELPYRDIGSHYMHVEYAPHFGADGRVLGFVAAVSDVTERRRAEQAMRKSEERLRAVAETAADAIITIDDASRIVYVNPAAERIFGHAASEMTGRNLTMLMPDYLRHAHEAGLGRYLKTGERHISWQGAELPGLHADGREISLEVSFAEFVEDGRRFFTGIARDVTERRRAEDARLLLAAVVESSDDAIISKTLDGRITSWNAGAEGMYGYTAEEAIGQHVSFIVPPDRAGELETIFESLRGGEPIKHLETVRVSKDGRLLDVAVTISPVIDGGGRLVGASTIARDITERKRVEEAVAASEQSYRSLADAMPQIVWTARPDGYYDYYNRRWFEYTGMTLEQTEGWGWQPVLHPEDVERFLRTWSSAVVSGHGYEIEYRFRRASDGQYRWHLGRAEPMCDSEGRVLKWFGTATDIHDQKQAADRTGFLAEAGALLASSLDYEATLERLARLTVPALADYCLIDMVGEGGAVARVATSHADPSKEGLIRRLRDYPPDMTRGAGVPSVLRSGRPEVIPDVTEEVLSSLSRDEAHRRILRELNLKSFMTVPLVARERIVGALTFASTTARHRYDADDLSFVGEIASRAALAIDNARLYREAREANRAKDEFLAMLSHELRTPLTPIIGWTHMMRAGRLPESDSAHGLDVIENNARSLTRLINDLLDMSSILSGKMTIERAPVDLAQAVSEAVETVRPQAERRGVRLEFSPPNGPARPLVHGDRTRLVQVFWNLLTNAVKFSGGAGSRVSVGFAAADGHARVEVADDGSGIAPEFLPHVFERFRQADGSTTRAHGGLGIGLALVKSLTEAHGGSVTAESEGAGRGSRFVVSLPLIRVREADCAWPAEGGVADRQAAGAVPQAAGAKPRVLVVEDSRDTLDMLRVVLSARGYEVTACESAAEALRLAPSMCFDIIVSDIGLPQTDGYELIGLLRQFEHLRATPAVALTGYAAPKDAEAALGAGFDLHVAKPVDPATLCGAVERLLEGRAAGPEAQS